jgi:zinc D-Ala-D-Ala carboxypeptidase
MQLSEHFSYAELTKSTTASRKGISNAPSKEHAANLVTLCNEVLEPLRKLYGRPIRISSGYRSPALNKLVGGSLASHHCLGMAVDIDQGSAAENMKIFNLLKAYGSFTQLIYEFGNLEDGPDWVHVSYDKDDLSREILRAVQVNKKTQYLKYK